MSVLVNIGGTWKTADKIFVKINNSWKEAGNIFVKTNDVWKSAYSFSWSIGSWSTCTVSCGGGTQSRTVECRRNDGKLFSDSWCSQPKPIVSQTCNTQACGNDCRYDQYRYCVTYDDYNYNTTFFWNKQAVRQISGNVESIISGGYEYWRGSYQGWDLIQNHYYTICRRAV